MIKSMQQIQEHPKDAVLQDGILKNFEDSPVTDGMLVKDIVYTNWRFE